MITAWDMDEFVLHPSRITLSIGQTRFYGDTFNAPMMDRHGVEIYKTSRNTVLFMTNIGTTRSSVAFLSRFWSRSPGNSTTHLRDEPGRARRAEQGCTG